MPTNLSPSSGTLFTICLPIKALGEKEVDASFTNDERRVP